MIAFITALTGDLGKWLAGAIIAAARAKARIRSSMGSAAGAVIRSIPP